MLQSIQTIEHLNAYIESFNELHYPDSILKPIFGGGKTDNPEVAFVFINPTRRNVASDPAWAGIRVPWIGILPIWKIFYEAQLIDSEIYQRIVENGNKWSSEFVYDLYEKIGEKGVYITNIVKWAGEDVTLPEKEKIERYVPILRRELELIKPKRIVTFGAIPFNALTGNKLKLQEFYDKSMKSERICFSPYVTNQFSTVIAPCYFPVGMGRFKQKEAINLLRFLAQEIQDV